MGHRTVMVTRLEPPFAYVAVIAPWTPLLHFLNFHHPLSFLLQLSSNFSTGIFVLTPGISNLCCFYSLSVCGVDHSTPQLGFISLVTGLLPLSPSPEAPEARSRTCCS